MVSLLVKDWEKDIVYLIQLPRAGSIPSLSPYCLKLETWLRMTDIKYQNISNDFTHLSHKDQIPYIELNGRQIADTSYIIQELTRIFHIQLDKSLNDKELAISLAFKYLLENGINWGNLYFRSLNNNFMATTDGIIGHFTGFKKFVFKNFVLGQRRRNLVNKCKAVGIGKDTPAEVEEMLKKQIDALSIYLDKSLFFMGNNPTSIDASAFAILSQFYYLPVNKNMKNYIDDKKNLVDYIRRMKERYWSDWNEATATLSLQTKPIRNVKTANNRLESI